MALPTIEQGNGIIYQQHTTARRKAMDERELEAWFPWCLGALVVNISRIESSNANS
jgi:hypothetical protein